jgi:hypothetical protein
MLVGYIPGKTIWGDFDLLGHSVSREGVYATRIQPVQRFVPGPEVGRTLETYEEMDGGIHVDDSYGPGEPQASGDSTKGGGVAGGKAAKGDC